MIHAYYTPHIASPVNDRRAGTIRRGWDTPQPIQVTKGYDNYLIFSFRAENQKRMSLRGKTLTGKVYNHNGIEMFSDNLDVLITNDGLAKFTITKSQSRALELGLYNLVLTYTDDNGAEQIANTSRSKPRFVIDVIDFSSTS
jgi:hypothetical protein